MRTLEEIKRYAIKCHNDTNHLYDTLPYVFHLSSVVELAEKYIYLIPKKDKDLVIAACWCHDLIEDTRQTWNDVIKETGSIEVAEIVYALTNEKGKTRKDRANDKYYKGIKDTRYATFVKLCDRLANTKYSKTTGGSMHSRYKEEFFDFYLELSVKLDGYGELYSEMWDELKTL